MMKHQEVAEEGRVTEGQGKGDEVREAMQGQTGPGVSYEGERKQLQRLGREIT